MAIKDRLKTAPPSATQTTPFACPHYETAPGDKRCRHYVGNGACDLPDVLMCEEWLKVNGQAVVPPVPSVPPAPSSSTSAPSPLPSSSLPPPTVPDDTPRDLFGNPLPEERKPASPPKSPANATVTKPDPPAKPPIVRNIRDEEIASFKALHVEVCLESDALGDIWIVPEYTRQARKEISVEHAATLTAICAAFPGAKVVRYEKAMPQPPATEPAS